MEPVKPRKEFLRSMPHFWLGCCTLGLGIISGNVLGLIVGAVGYILGWLYIPDSKWFLGKIEERLKSAISQDEQTRVVAFAQKRQNIFNQLSSVAQNRYYVLAATCAEIEKLIVEDAPGAADPRLAKLDEFMWNFLKLLALEEKLKNFLGEESETDIQNQLKEARKAAEKAQAEAGDTAPDSKKRIAEASVELVQILEQRLQKVEQAKTHLQLAQTEQQRLEQQIKLIKAEFLSSRKTDALSERISSAVDHFNTTNAWMQQMDDFKTITAEELPVTTGRIGYQAPAVTQSNVGWKKQYQSAADARDSSGRPIPVPPKLPTRQ